MSVDRDILVSRENCQELSNQQRHQMPSSRLQAQGNLTLCNAYTYKKANASALN